MTAALCWGLRPLSSASGSRLITGPVRPPSSSAGGSAPASAQEGTPRASTSPLEAAGLSLGRGKSPKRVLIVSSSLRRAGDNNTHPLTFDLGAQTMGSALDEATCLPGRGQGDKREPPRRKRTPLAWRRLGG